MLFLKPYLKPSQKSKMQRFVKLGNDLHTLAVKSKSSILDL